MTGGYIFQVSHYCRFKRRDSVYIPWGRYAPAVGIVDSAVLQHTVHYPGEYSAGYHAVLEDEMVVTVGWGQVSGVQIYEM